MNVVDREEAQEQGFATFNGCKHLLVDVPEGAFTITCRSGKKLATFCFLPNVAPKSGHQCVHIVHHTGKIGKDGVPYQQASFYGQGPTNAAVTYKDETPTTVVSLSLKDE